MLIEPPSDRESLSHLQLLHLADSALPVGALAHSFGLESLTAEEILTTGNLESFLRAHIEEAGLLEAVFCRQAFRLASDARAAEKLPIEPWIALNFQLTARKPAREARTASATIGRTFLMAVKNLGDYPVLREALTAAKESGTGPHHSLAFGLASAILHLDENLAALSFVHQSVSSLVSACQRLLPLGQTAATRILWNVKPAMIACAEASASCAVDSAFCFLPMLDWGAMEHPALATRLFIS
jgi:urease accessory protein